MKIYIAHSKGYDYKNELYLPIRNDNKLTEHEIILPHEFSDSSSNTREFYRSLDLVIAEGSYPATGLGIELGWAYDDETPIYCIHKQGMKISGSIYAVTQNIEEYSNTEEMLSVIENIIELEQNKARKNR